MAMKSNLIDMKTAGAQLGVSKSQMHRFIDDGLLDCQKVDARKLIVADSIPRAQAWLDSKITIAEAAERTGLDPYRIAYVVAMELFTPAMRDQSEGLKAYNRIDEMLADPASRRVLLDPADLDALVTVERMFSVEPLFEEFADVLRSRSRDSTFAVYEFQVAGGWRWLLADALRAIRETVESPDLFRVSQIKEKFGGLRFYYRYDGDKAVGERLYEIVQRAENQSYGTCEVCGQPGELRKRSWWRTLCDKHDAIS